MKKAISLALALVLAFSCMTMAFAAGEFKCGCCGKGFDTAAELAEHHTNKDGTTQESNKCGCCSYQAFDTAEELADHHAKKDAAATTTTTTTTTTTEAVEYICPYCGAGDFYTAEMYHAHLDTCPAYTANYVDMSVSEILAYLLKVIDLDNARLTIIKPIIANIVDYVNDFIKGITTSDSGVKGAVSDLESKLGEFKLDIGKGKIKDILDALKQKIKDLYCGEPATTAEPPAETGSSAATGIAVFAAVSVAAAAAYVCTKKNDEE